MEQYCASHEDVLEWLLEAEDKLKSWGDVPETLDEVKSQFQTNIVYMAYLKTNQEAVGKVLKSGKDLLTPGGLSSYQDKDIRVRNKLLLDRWESLRKKSMAREGRVHVKLMEMQRAEMKNLRDWMTEMEDRISKMGPILASTIDTQQTQQFDLEADISQHQVRQEIIISDNAFSSTRIFVFHTARLFEKQNFRDCKNSNRIVC